MLAPLREVAASLMPGHGVRLWAVVNLDGPTLKQQILSS